jgi:predicted nucleic acid-binding protein
MRMSDYFCDSSGIVKRYVLEVGSHWMQQICDPTAGNEIWVSVITGVEVMAAIWRKVREGTLPHPLAARIADEFREHFRHQYRVVELLDAIVEEAMELVERHSLRGYDAVQLASAKWLNRQLLGVGLPPLIFVSADEELLAAAQAEGLVTENPNQKP